METLKPNPHFRSCAALLATACLMLPLLGGDSRAPSGGTSQSVSVDEAQELIRKGDEAYTAERYAQATEAYAGARELLVKAAMSDELLAAVTERYAQASVEHARVLSRGGDVIGAQAVVDKVLDPSVAPGNTAARLYRNQLNDPIRTNPALTKKHAEEVDAVRRLLYTAEGAQNLGKYDEAKSTYEKVLRLDPTNSAARRGLEQVSQAKIGYYESAYDQTRAEMLNQVDSQWEQQVPTLELEKALDAIDMGNTGTQAITVQGKLNRIIIPKIALDQASLEEAIDFLRVQARDNDTTELDLEQKGVNFALNLGEPNSPEAVKIRETRFDLLLSNVPLSQILKHISEITSTTITTDDFSVIISAAGSTSQQLISRSYRVPPDFISTLSSAAPTEPANADPFNTAPASGGALTQRLGAQEALTLQGVNFPAGASANYIPASNSLRVVNTPAAQEYIAQLIETITKTEPVIVSVKVTMIKVEQSRLEELGFDWFLESNSNNSIIATGGTTGNGKQITDVATPSGVSKLNPVTAGNRSGDYALNSNSIDAVINNAGGRQTSNPAPGILGLAGSINNSDVQMLMRGLDQKTGADVLAQPAVVTRSGQSSTIKIVREFIYATEYEPPELPNQVSSGGFQFVVTDIDGNIIQAGDTGANSGGFPVTPATPTAFETRDVGITLEVLPVVDADKQFITVTLNPEFSEFEGFVNYGSPINSTITSPLGISETIPITENTILMPIFSNRTTSTTVDVADGATVVVGGLMQEVVELVEDKTPILGNIPLLGRLFQSTVKRPVSKMILFLVNVELMDPTGHRYRNR